MRHSLPHMQWTRNSSKAGNITQAAAAVEADVAAAVVGILGQVLWAALGADFWLNY